MKIGTFSRPIKEIQYSAQKSVFFMYTQKSSEEFVIRFKDFRMNENGFSLFANPVTADIDNSPT